MGVWESWGGGGVGGRGEAFAGAFERKVSADECKCR